MNVPFRGFAVCYWTYSLDRLRWERPARKALWMKAKGQETEWHNEAGDEARGHNGKVTHGTRGQADLGLNPDSATC